MKKILWKASKEKKKNSNLKNYEIFIKKYYNIKIKNNFSKIHNWSVKNSNLFWNSFWEFSKVKGIKKEGCKIYKDLFKSKFLIDSKLNFAENLLVKKDNSIALTFVSENGFKEKKSWKDLYVSISRIINFLKKNKIKKNDRVAA